ncbi:NXPE family member 3-like [Gastrophryne carolinensis]
MEKECLAIVWSLQRLQPYLYGRHFIVETDHNSLRWLHMVSGTNGRLLRLALQQYQFDIRHRKGRDHGNADGLSRQGEVAMLEHRQHVKAVLQKLRENSLYAKLSKCLFEIAEISFLGYLVSNRGLVMGPSKAYHPQSNGQTEKVNQSLEQYLRCFVSDCQEQWSEFIEFVEFTFNNAPSDSTKFSPFFFKLPLSMKIPNAFHVSLLKTTGNIQVSSPPPVIVEDEPEITSTYNWEKYTPPPFSRHACSTDTLQATFVSTMNPKFVDLLKQIEWPEPPSTVKELKFSTSPKNCHYHLLNPQNSYRVGEMIEVVITAKDHDGRPKMYGGDFFQAKLHSPKLKAGVTGQVKDYGNGSYVATFLLPWPGEAQIHIRLIHSSEAVDVLKKKRHSQPGKVYFHGHYVFNGSTEVVECNLKVTSKNVCIYKDPISGNTWECVKPLRLPCHSWRYHIIGGYRNVLDKMETMLLSGAVTDQIIRGSASPINVMSDNRSLDLTANLPACRPGQEPPKPSGYYYNDVWTSLTCAARHFSQPSEALECLKGKDIYMIGDSTLRQWFEYLEKFIPSLKRIDLHVSYNPGPLLAVDADNGLGIRFQSHGLPFRTGLKIMIPHLQYTSSQLSRIGGGPHTVVFLNIWAHLTSYPVTVYLERLEKIQQAVASLLLRSPQTKVIIKSANTGGTSVDNSDWLSLQLDTLLRATFRGMAVTIIDAWDMTSCHYLPEDIHPGPPVIKNEIDLALSYICPK